MNQLQFHRLLLVPVLLLMPGSLWAQESAAQTPAGMGTLQAGHTHGECTTAPGPAEVPLIRELERKGMYLLENAPELVFQIPMTFHIVRRANGTGGPTVAALDGDIPVLNATFLPAGIQFFRTGPVDFIDSNFFFNQITTQGEADLLRLMNPVANTINVYFVDDFSVAGISLCGQSSFTSSTQQGIIMDKDCMPNAGNPSTLTHEFGHYFDLYHTHETVFGLECPNGSNCFSSGDLLCDTPADPRLTGQVDMLCNYIGTRMRCGQFFNPQVPNYMGIAPPICRNLFTPQQINRMGATLVNLRFNLLGSQAFVVWCDFDHTGVENGSFARPWNTLAEAVVFAPIGSKIVIKGGTSSEALVIAKDVTIDSFQGTATVGQ